jgi:hypothetical protein
MNEPADALFNRQVAGQILPLIGIDAGNVGQRQHKDGEENGGSGERRRQRKEFEQKSQSTQRRVFFPASGGNTISPSRLLFKLFGVSVECDENEADSSCQEPMGEGK